MVGVLYFIATVFIWTICTMEDIIWIDGILLKML